MSFLLVRKVVTTLVNVFKCIVLHLNTFTNVGRRFQDTDKWLHTFSKIINNAAYLK